jgi:GAF domain-containing protein
LVAFGSLVELEGAERLTSTGGELLDIQMDELMDSIDALGLRPDLHTAFTGELLAEAEDEVLRSIVEEAAQNLSAPIALVTLVLEEIQFFKAHYGLPPDLAAARGTERDVSFCQFVVRDGKPFEVINAEQDARVPQHLVKHYGIRSYLGLPVVANDVIVGSICVIDTKPREFSDEERRVLNRLADLVNARLATLSKGREQLPSFLVDQAAVPALAELREALAPIQASAAAGCMSTTALASFLRLMEHAASGSRQLREQLL